jgi:hypothetical protein
MQNIIGGMQNNYTRLVRTFDKSTVANFPSHEIQLGETRVIHRLQVVTTSYNPFCPGQPQPPTHIGNKLADLHMTGPSAQTIRASNSRAHVQ